MAHENFAAIPATLTYALTELAFERVVELERRLENLRPNQRSRRDRIGKELTELNAAIKIMRDAQESQIVSLKDKLGASRSLTGTTSE